MKWSKNVLSKAKTNSKLENLFAISLLYKGHLNQYIKDGHLREKWTKQHQQMKGKEIEMANKYVTIFSLLLIILKLSKVRTHHLLRMKWQRFESLIISSSSSQGVEKEEPFYIVDGNANL